MANRMEHDFPLESQSSTKYPDTFQHSANDDPEWAHRKYSVDRDPEDHFNESQLQLAWGRYGKLWLWAGVVIMWTVFEFDNATTYNYQNIATSEFQSISSLGALSTGGTIVAAVMKPPWARLSDVIGRAENVCHHRTHVYHLLRHDSVGSELQHLFRRVHHLLPGSDRYANPQSDHCGRHYELQMARTRKPTYWSSVPLRPLDRRLHRRLCLEDRRMALGYRHLRYRPAHLLAMRYCTNQILPTQDPPIDSRLLSSTSKVRPEPALTDRSRRTTSAFRRLCPASAASRTGRHTHLHAGILPESQP